MSLVIGSGVLACWVFRELLGYRKQLEHNHLRQRYQILETEWSASRKEIHHLREMNTHLQTVFKEQASAMRDSRKDMENRLQ